MDSAIPVKLSDALEAFLEDFSRQVDSLSVDETLELYDRVAKAEFRLRIEVMTILGNHMRSVIMHGDPRDS